MTAPDADVGPVIGADQRRAAYGILTFLCLAWAALGMAGIVTAYDTPVGMDGTGGYLLLLAVAGAVAVLVAAVVWVSGIRAVRRIEAGTWHWRGVVVTAGAGSASSALVGAMVAAALPVLTALLVVQAVTLVALAAVLRPVSDT